MQISSSVSGMLVFSSIMLTSALSTLAAANQNLPQSDNQLAGGKAIFDVCIDDSDCKHLGADKYACFKYLCYPWKDDSEIAVKDRIKTCRRDRDCDYGQDCVRHGDVREVTKGICFEESSDCEQDSECSPGLKCCGYTCCNPEYKKEFANLPCASNQQCEDLYLGQWCCPAAKNSNKTDTCCNVDPNPAPTTEKSSPLSGASSVSALPPAVFLAALAVQIALTFVVAEGRRQRPTQ